jgi:hypothetical protein
MVCLLLLLLLLSLPCTEGTAPDADAIGAAAAAADSFGMSSKASVMPTSLYSSKTAESEILGTASLRPPMLRPNNHRSQPPAHA